LTATNRPRRRVFAGVIAGLGWPGLVGLGAAASGSLPTASVAQIRPGPTAGTVDSLNWAGYAVTPGSGVTAVSSTFTVPAAGLLPPGFSATWTGIGGYSTTDLIQAGVAEEDPVTSLLLGSQYYAWYEILPASETQISGCSGDPSCTVSPGDHMSVRISSVGNNTWDVSLTDAGHWTWSQDLTYASSESSAEWIQEAPSLAGLQTVPAGVGTVSFGTTDTYTEGGVTRTIAEGNPTLIDESPGLVNLATPSALAGDGQSFNVCVYAQSCPAP
jgi:hypothetical protein